MLDKDGNIINQKGQIIFKKHQIDPSGELPAPFVYQKYKWAFLQDVTSPKSKVLEISQEIEDDEQIIE